MLKPRGYRLPVSPFPGAGYSKRMFTCSRSYNIFSGQNASFGYISKDEEKMATNVAVKQEPVDFIDIESKVIELCKDNPKGITDSLIQEEIPSISVQQRVKAINRLLSTVR